MITTTDCVQKNPMYFCHLSIPCPPNDNGKTWIATNATTHSYKSRTQYIAYDCVYTCVVDYWIEQASGIGAWHDSMRKIVTIKHVSLRALEVW
jgi:hypothetical protein